MIPFNTPPFVGNELDYMKQAVESKKICGDGAFTKKCHSLLEQQKKKAAFPFGFGLSYTTFAYTDPQITDEGDRYAISLTVQNTGDRDGKTVIQIYAAAPGERAEKKLKGFRKVFVKAGESTTQTVYVEKEDLRFYNPEQKAWYLADCYEFFVGQHCEDTQRIQF